MSNQHTFGWSLPPGAAGDPNAPYNQQDHITKLQDDVWELLEAAGFSSEQCNNVMSVIMDCENEIARASEEAYWESQWHSFDDEIPF